MLCGIEGLMAGEVRYDMIPDGMPKTMRKRLIRKRVETMRRGMARPDQLLEVDWIRVFLVNTGLDRVCARFIWGKVRTGFSL